jgi:hypothetical protein
LITDQTFATLLVTAVIVALGVVFSNSRLSDINNRLSDTNGRIDVMQQNLGLALQNMTLLIHAESTKLQGVVDAHLRRLEEKLNSR